MSITILILVAAGVMGFLAYALTPRGLDQFQDAIRLPLGRNRPYGNGEEGR